jgi:hypothetical protein
MYHIFTFPKVLKTVPKAMCGRLIFQPVALLGVCGTFRRWDLVEGS